MTPLLSAQHVDITSLQVDAIVNAANPQLVPGGGVCGAIFRSAGAGLREACMELSPCSTGDAVITPGFSLPARFVIHAVGPVWQGGQRGEERLLASAYRRSLELADHEGLTTIAFPAISTGVYGFPAELAARVAVATVQDVLTQSCSVTTVVFACFSPEMLTLYRRAGVDG